jgi:hypothetical protein
MNAYTDEYLESPLINASIIVCRKSPFSIKIVSEWLELCKLDRLISFATGSNEHSDFKWTCSDQSILNVLLKKYMLHKELPSTFPLYSVHNRYFTLDRIIDMTKKIVICISSRSPNPLLFKCIQQLYNIQIKDDPRYTICVVDSDSSDFTVYNIIANVFPNVEIHYAKNTHYEFGAWKYIYTLYSDYDIYFCIQDSTIVQSYIHLDRLTDTTAYTYHDNGGYITHQSIKQKGIDALRDSGLEYTHIVDTAFTLAQHSIFGVTRTTMKDIFETLHNNIPIDKDGSCYTERNLGIYFICKQMQTIALNNHMIKIHGKRV